MERSRSIGEGEPEPAGARPLGQVAGPARRPRPGRDRIGGIRTVLRPDLALDALEVVRVIVNACERCGKPGCAEGADYCAECQGRFERWKWLIALAMGAGLMFFALGCHSIRELNHGSAVKPDVPPKVDTDAAVEQKYGEAIPKPKGAR